MKYREYVDRSREIEDAAELVRQTIIDKQHKLWPGRQLTEIELLCPQRMAEAFGVDYREIKGMGRQMFPQRGENFKVAGSLDMQSMTITIDADNSEEFKRFTAMHEIGHIVLHPNLEKVHRDVLRGGKDLMDSNQPQHEREANFFAACALMPRAMVINEFTRRFGNELPFVMKDIALGSLIRQTTRKCCAYPENLSYASRSWQPAQVIKVSASNPWLSISKCHPMR